MEKVKITVGAWLRHRKTKQKEPKPFIKEDYLFWYTDWKPELVGVIAEVVDKDEEYVWVKIKDATQRLNHDQYEPEEAQKVGKSKTKNLQQAKRDKLD